MRFNKTLNTLCSFDYLIKIAHLPFTTKFECFFITAQIQAANKKPFLSIR